MSDKEKRIEVVPLILALLPILALIVGLAHSGPDFEETEGDVVRTIPPGSTEPGVYRPEPPAAEEFVPPAAPDGESGAAAPTGAVEDEAPATNPEPAASAEPAPTPPAAEPPALELTPSAPAVAQAEGTGSTAPSEGTGHEEPAPAAPSSP